MQRISNSAFLLPVAESALRPVNTSFALISRLATRFLRSAAALFGKAPGLDSPVRRRLLLTPRARAVSGKAGFRSLSAIGIAASAALIVALAPSAFAVVATTDTITVQSATGSPACSSDGLTSGTGIICANNNTPFSLTALEKGTQTLNAVVGGHDATYLVVNDTANAAFTLTYTGTAQSASQAMRCGNTLTSTAASLCMLTGSAGEVQEGGNTASPANYGPVPSTGWTGPPTAQVSFNGLPTASGSQFEISFTYFAGSSDQGTLTGACYGTCQMPVSCTGGNKTIVTGTVYVPNGKDPLPDALIYIPSAYPGPLTPGVQCVTQANQAQGSPVTYTYSAVDGTFTLTNVPTGANIPIVIQSGKWRMQGTISNVSSCTTQAAPAWATTMPSTRLQGDIPKIALVTGNVDALECVLRKTGIADSEFTNSNGTGRINFYKGGGSPGVQIDSATPAEETLVSSPSTLANYDMVMFPCQGAEYDQSQVDQTNLIDYANAGGRVFATHYSYVWLYDDTPFSTVATWHKNWDPPSPDPGMATVNTGFTDGSTLANWLQLPTIGASTTLGQISINTLRLDQAGEVSPTQSWLTLNTNNTDQTGSSKEPAHPDMQLTFNTPVGAPGAQQCGRVLFNDYHVYNAASLGGQTFPSECGSATTMTPQEHLLEFALFDLTKAVVPVTTVSASQSFTNTPASFTQGDASDTIAILVTDASSTINLDATVQVAGALPTGVTVNTSTFSSGGWTCTSGSGGSGFTCTRTTILAAGASDTIYVPVMVATNAPTGGSLTSTISGGGLSSNVVGTDPLTILGGHSIGWATPASIVYGTPLGAGQLDASALCSGTFAAGTYAYKYGSTTVTTGSILPAGNDTLTVTFTPATITTACPVQTDTVVQVVTPAPLTVTANNLTKTYGTANPTLTDVIAGYVNGDTLSSFTGSATMTTGAGLLSPVAGYPITFSSQTLANPNYTVSYVPGTLTITQGLGTITWAPPAAITYGTPLSATQLNAVATCGGTTATGTYAYTPALGTVLSAGINQTLSVTFTPTDTLDCPVETTTVQLTVNKVALAVTANNQSMNYGSAVPSLTGTLTGVVSGDNITASYTTTGTSSSSAGTYPITAALSDPNSKLSNYSVTNTPGTLTINKVPQTIVFAPTSPVTYGVSPIALSATGGASGNPVTYSLVSGPAVLNNGVLTITGAGSVVVAANQAGNTNYTDASPVTKTIVVNPAPLTVTAADKSMTYGGTVPTLTGTLTGVISGDTLTASYSTTGNSTSAVGPYPITATLRDPGSKLANYNVTYNSGTLTIGKAPQSIVFTMPATVAFGVPVNLSAIGGPSGNPVTFTLVSGPATLTGNVLTATGVGVIVVAADQAGNANYLPAAQVTQSTQCIQLPQVITFNPTSPVNLGVPPITLTATGGASGNPVTFTLVSGPATLNGNVLTITGGGAIVIDANQLGNAYYLPAATVEATILVVADCDTSLTEPVGATSSIQTAVIQMPSNFTLGSISVGMLGAPGLDYAIAPGGTCAIGTSYTAGQVCTVNYTFTPSVPGTRLGNVILSDNSTPAGVVKQSIGINGTGTGPMVAFYPGTQTTVDSNIYYSEGVAVDGHGNLYATAVGLSQVKMESWSGTTYTPSVLVGAGLSNPFGLAVDCRGNIYIADEDNNRIVKETWTGSGYIESTVDGNLTDPNGVAVDCAGNVYVADSGTSRVLKETWANGIYTPSVIADAGKNNIKGPQGVAVDGNGNVYILDTGSQRALKETPSNGGYIETTVAIGLNNPMGIAVDALGDVFISDTGNSRVLKERPSNGGYIQTVVPTSGVTQPYGLTVDGSGNIYICDPKNNRIVKVNVSSAPALTFATTVVGSTSSDSPQTVTLTNIGNRPLAFPILASGNNPSISANFSLNSSGVAACPLIGSSSSTPGTLAVGASCTLPVSFVPGVAGALAGSLVVTDDNLNVVNATQTIPLNGTGVTAGATTTTLTSSLNPSFAGGPVTFTATVAQAIGSLKPTGTVQFAVDGISAGSPVTLSNGIASYTTSALAAGTHSITATYSPNPGSAFLGSSSTPLIQVVSPFNGAVTLHLDSTQLVYPGQTNLTACVTSGNAPTATGTIGIYDGTKLLVTLTLQGNGCAYWYITPGLSAGTHTLTAKYAGDKNNPAGSSSPVTVTVGLAPVTMEDACWNDSFSYGGNYQCNANMDSGTKTGYMTYVYDGGAPVKMPLNAAGAMEFILTMPSVGTHTLVIAYPQQGNYQGATLPVHTFIVTAAPVNVALVPSSWTPAFGASVTFTAKVTSTSGVAPKSAGSVMFYDGSKLLATVAVNASGQATYSNSSLASGTHTLTATYSGGTGYGTGSGTAAINVGAAPQTITFTGLPATATYGASGPYTLKATASSGLAVSYSVTGPATISGSTLTLTGAGTVAATASQAGNNSFSAAKPVTLSITVGKATTTTKLTAASTTPAAGSTDLLTVTVTGGSPTGSVVFMAGSTTVCTSAIGAGGVATCSYTPSAAGSVTITANYQGGANNLASSATLPLTCKAAAPATISVQYASTQLVFPGATNITACITSLSHTIPTGTVGIYDGTTLLTTQTLQGNGCAYWYIAPGLSAGKHAVTAKYSGDNSNGAVTSTATTLTVSPAPANMSASWSSNFFTYGGNYTTTVTVTSNSNAGQPAGSITYSLDGATAVPVALSNGAAMFAITKPAAGNHKLVIAYAQQTNYAAASPFTESFTVTPAPVNATLTPSTTSPAKNSSVTFTAAVTSSNALIPTGTVTFTEGGVTLAVVPVDAGGKAAFSTASLTVGVHSIRATYAGSPNFGAGSSTTGVTVK
jgi:sugar lactone lactonase YvrE